MQNAGAKRSRQRALPETGQRRGPHWRREGPSCASRSPLPKLSHKVIFGLGACLPACVPFLLPPHPAEGRVLTRGAERPLRRSCLPGGRGYAARGAGREGGTAPDHAALPYLLLRAGQGCLRNCRRSPGRGSSAIMWICRLIQGLKRSPKRAHCASAARGSMPGFLIFFSAKHCL